MANEYIRKQDAIEEIRKAENHAFNSFYKGLVKAHKIVADLLPADVAPVAHSRWIKTADGAECEKCGREAVYQIIDDHWQYEPFCPHCGAKMDGGKNT